MHDGGQCGCVYVCVRYGSVSVCVCVSKCVHVCVGYESVSECVCSSRMCVCVCVCQKTDMEEERGGGGESNQPPASQLATPREGRMWLNGGTFGHFLLAGGGGGGRAMSAYQLQ